MYATDCISFKGSGPEVLWSRRANSRTAVGKLIA